MVLNIPRQVSKSIKKEGVKQLLEHKELGMFDNRKEEI
ncbi:hypothetical protein DESME_09160 [Desulfitobacterium metallireducens DSM 15288]|uniref:Uncharacterized protein n=1 Tax=Desulfitobacterium metallireducens DSM 15288 TaxID=871968 RepID=W0ECV1_9FIRM|nr:hypothetical protein DESME_09160 [Desulfitobacterium metallireducens DSM 15288]